MPKRQLILPGILSVVLTSLLIIAIVLSPRKETAFSPMPQLDKRISHTIRDGGAIASAGEKASKLLSKSQRTQLNKVLLTPLSRKLFDGQVMSNNDSSSECESRLDYELLSEPQAVVVLGKVIQYETDCKKKTIAFFEMDKKEVNVRGINDTSYLAAQKWLANFEVH